MLDLDLHKTSIEIVKKRMDTLKSIIPKTSQMQSEHHQKDDEGNVIEHEETTPSSVEEGLGGNAVKVAGKMVAKQVTQGAADRAGEGCI